MPPVFCAGGTVLVTGLRFDLERVLTAYERLVDAFDAAASGPSSVMTQHADRVALPWPDPGRKNALGFWRRAAEVFEVVDEPLIHQLGGLTVKAYLLGKTWCVYDRKQDKLFTPTREDVSELDPKPIICFYGPMRDNDPSTYGLLNSSQIAEVRRLMTGPLAELSLELQEAVIARDRSGASLGAAFAEFPHAVYGDGLGPIRVRCIETDGSLVEKNTASD